MSRTLFFGGLSAETNSFSSIPTTYASFEEEGMLRGDQVLYEAGEPKPSAAPILSFARNNGFEIRAGLFASAAPGAPTEHSDYERLRDELLEGIRDAGPAAVLLSLHGAMISTECDDCEGDILRRAREIVGSNVPIAAVLDPHAHLTDQMVEQADFLVFMKEYPHTDGLERTEEALAVIKKLLEREPRLTVAIHDCELVGFFPTTEPAMRQFVDWLFELEERPEVVSVSFVHGFPWGDTHHLGAKVLVYTRDDSEAASAVAKEVSDRIWKIKDETMFDTVNVQEAVRLMLKTRNAPLVCADIADNTGGGAPGDSTFVLQELLKQGVSNVAIGLLFDPEVVKQCHAAGVGADLVLSVGGKLGEFSGDPICVSATVMGVAEDVQMNVLDLVEFPLGDTAWLRISGVDLVLISVRTQTYSPHGFTHLGLDLDDKRAIVVKSTNHFRATFDTLADEFVYINTPGAINYDLAAIPYRVFNKPYYPRGSSS